jgi:GT2 family glycosyltransferase/glycosyltransferase involved in cell wall biosynthesis
MPVSVTTDIAEATALLSAAPSPVVVVAVYNAYDDVVRCLEAIAAHTSPDIAVLIVDDGGSDRRLASLLGDLGSAVRHRVVVLEHEQNLGFVRSCNDAFAATAGRDVVVVNSDVVVGPEWLDRLTAAALSMDTIATATTLTNRGSIVTVPGTAEAAASLLDGMTPDEAARRVAKASRRLRPTLPTAVGHCFYIRRAALDLVGPFDVTFDPGYGEEVDFSQRALAHGFRHVLADDVFTFHKGSSSFGQGRDVATRRQRHESIVEQRHPWYPQLARQAVHDPASTLAEAIGIARRALQGLTVGVDALSLGPHLMGTQRIVVETIRALARRPEISRLVVYIPPFIADYVKQLRRDLPAVEFVSLDPILGFPKRTVDLIYRPCQVFRIVELDFLAHVGDRFVVNQLDTILFDNPAYFGTYDDWLTYRGVTRLTLELAQGVAFLSSYVHRAVTEEGLLPPSTPWAVVSCGVEPSETHDIDEGTRPSAVPADADGYVLCIGASYLHKNRQFALEVWARLRQMGWSGRLVLAGPTPPAGHSLTREAEFLLGAPDLRPDVVTLGAVTEAEKRWLYRHAGLVLYPSTVEGFGLVPFEAAHHGAPTLATRQAALDEVLPADIPTLAGFDAGAAADLAWTLLHDEHEADRLTARLRDHGTSFTWDATAERLLGLFDQALGRPRGRGLVIEGEGKQRIGLASRSERTFRSNGSAVALERLVQAVVSRPALKNSLSPTGSRRQRIARSVIARARNSRG